VKDGIDMFTASCLHPEVTQKGIREGVARALKAMAKTPRPPYRGKTPYRFGFEWNTTTIASTCALIPTVAKVNPRTTEFKTDNLPQAMGLILAKLFLALQVGQKSIYG
jgi:D-amino peptidase